MEPSGFHRRFTERERLLKNDANASGTACATTAISNLQVVWARRFWTFPLS